MKKIPKEVMSKYIVGEENTGNGVLNKNPIRPIDKNLNKNLKMVMPKPLDEPEERKEKDLGKTIKSTIPERDRHPKSNRLPSRFEEDDNSSGKKEATAGNNCFKESDNENYGNVAEFIKNEKVVVYN